MKYSCNMIQDLIPLYIDGVCSEESKEAVEQHLSECPDCTQLCVKKIRYIWTLMMQTGSARKPLLFRQLRREYEENKSLQQLFL